MVMFSLENDGLLTIRGDKHQLFSLVLFELPLIFLFFMLQEVVKTLNKWQVNWKSTLNINDFNVERSVNLLLAALMILNLTLTLAVIVM